MRLAERERQTVLGRGHHGEAVGPPALEVRLDALGPGGDRLLGGGPQSRLFMIVREQKGYAYDARTEIAHRINLKFAPEIRFKIDDTFDNVAKIDALLNSDKVKQDLQPRQPAEKEPAEK